MKKITKQEQQTLLTMIKEQQIKYNVAMILKIEKILKGRRDLIPSPSVKIQIMGKKVCLKAKHCWACRQTFENKLFVDITQQCFALLPKLNFSANNLYFH